MKNIKACLSHQTDEWKTPKVLYDAFMKNGYKDPCPIDGNENALTKNYYKEKLFINPPFSKLKEFIEWIIQQKSNGCEIWLLMPVRTDTKYFKRLYETGIQMIYFCEGRLHYNDSKSAPFPSMLVKIQNSILFNNAFYNMGTIEKFIKTILEK